MRQKISKERLLFLIVPIVVAVWPLWLTFSALPAASKGWDSDVKKIDDARNLITEIMRLDPDRLQNVDAKGALVKFEYPVAVNKVASACNVSPSAYKINVLPAVKPSTGQASQDAIVTIDKVSVTTATEFVSLAEQRYNPNLRCIQLGFKRIRDQKDLWEIDLTFRHFE
jgi:hypothetical protein